MVTPRKAATCIIRRVDGDNEILFGKRNVSLRFMGGHHVFPGGRIDDGEGTAHVVETDDVDHATRVHAAAREAFEEVGILCVRGELPDANTTQAAQGAVLDGTVTFDGVLEKYGLYLDARDFEPAAHWITPANSPIRFDTRYMMYRYEGGQTAHFVKGEMVGLDWFTAKEARRQWRLGEIDLPTPVAITLRMLAAVPYPKVLDVLNRSANLRSEIQQRLEVRCGVTAVALKTKTLPPATHTNCVIVGEEEIVLIDPGPDEAEDQEILRRHVQHDVDLGAKVKAVLLTHSHRDHTGAATFIRETFGAPIWAHEAVAPQIDFELDKTIAHDDLIECAGDPPWRLRAIHTPGHDPGHLCFIEETTGVLICGDMQANPGTIVVSQASGGDMNDFIESLERLIEVDSQILLPAHGMAMDDPKVKLKEHLDHRLWREQKIKAAFEGGAKSLQPLLEAAYDDVPREVLPIAEHALRAHLARLGFSVGS